MNAFFRKKKILKNCRIYQMLRKQNGREHLSFHTPGHKYTKWDITELSYSDNLSNPKGCIKRAETEIADLLGAKRSLILTDGSTSGIFSMLYAAKKSGVERLALPFSSHKSVYNACAVFGIEPVVFQTEKDGDGLEKAPALNEIERALEKAQALLLTSPNYYGRIPDLKEISALCKRQGKPLLIDGAHGGHLRFHKNLYAGTYADFWVDGVHKSLPAFTQGAVVSAKTEDRGALLKEGADVFRTTSPSYPILASVEYAVKYPENEKLEAFVRAFARENKERIRVYEDYTKLCALFGKTAFQAEKFFEKRGIFPEFCDGNVIEFYLSPATRRHDLDKLVKALKKAFEIFPYESVGLVPAYAVSVISPDENDVEAVELEGSENRICARTCGLFPPCTPLIFRGEKISEEKIELLKNADLSFGLEENKIIVFKE